MQRSLISPKVEVVRRCRIAFAPPPSLWLRYIEGFLRRWTMTNHLMIPSVKFHSKMQGSALKCNFLKRQRKKKYHQHHQVEPPHKLRLQILVSPIPLNQLYTNDSTPPTLHTSNVRYQSQVRAIPQAIRSRDPCPHHSIGPTTGAHLLEEGGQKKKKCIL